ncbi:MAG TPA: UvrB/UvrC motif-containing protein, partial [Candidatus Saccharimonadales bacterium]|nr:UvrB/UvrC motif-containing protein [Candidatus Saccharimonadales bacterium]
YRANLRKLMQYLRGQRVALTREIERDMKAAAKAQDFEKAAKLRNQLFALQQLNRQILFGDRELQDAAKDEALVGLAGLLGLESPPRRIEGFDISHMQGTDNVASMVVFDSGVPNKAAYRKFKMRLAGNDDFAHMAETITRRLREENRKKWGMADLMLIDGGKGQLGAAITARDKCGMARIPMIGLAKKEEEIIISSDNSLPGVDIELLIDRATQAGAYVSDSDNFISVLLPKNSPAVKLLQRIRDESHRFAVSYHTVLKRGRQTKSLLDEIPGVGPTTKKRLIRSFGSTKGVLAANEAELKAALGTQRGAVLYKHLSNYR